MSHTWIVFTGSILIFIGCILIISIIWLHYLLIHHYLKYQKHDMQKILFYPACAQLITANLCLLAILSMIIGHITYIPPIFYQLHGILYWLQMHLLSLVLTIRLYLIFNNTLWALSRVTIAIYKSLYTLSFISLIILPPITIISPILLGILTQLMFFISIVIVVSLSILFVYKLNKIH
eukprot:500700_1